ncbi:MAG: hypothetical protein Q6373_001630 [Candidatus Sigynarchaeota archaeon]
MAAALIALMRQVLLDPDDNLRIGSLVGHASSVQPVPDLFWLFPDDKRVGVLDGRS